MLTARLGAFRLRSIPLDVIAITTLAVALVLSILAVDVMNHGYPIDEDEPVLARTAEP